MSKLAELIKELCPDGVRKMQLGDIGKVSMCKRILKSDTATTGDVPFYKIGTFGKEADAFISYEKYEEFRRKYSYPNKGDILISAAGTIGRTVIYDGSPAYYQDSNIVWLAHDESIVLNKYLYYCYELQPWAVSSGGTISRLYNDNIMKAEIYVPPIPVQREIIRIMDEATALYESLERKLNDELEARKKQYEYYRDALLTFAGGQTDSSVCWLKLGECCNISAGGDIPKGRYDKNKNEKFTVPIISNGIGDNAIYGYTDIAKINEDSVTVAARGTIGYAAYRDYPYYPIIRLLSIVPKNTSVLNAKFLYYVLQGRKYNVPTTGIPQLTAPSIKKEVIPVPSLEEQQRIVDILDRFDKLCNDLSEGLPAEIAARQKQYEYYRDKLLTFKEKKA